MFNVDSFKNSRVIDAAAKTAGFIFKGKICKLYCIVSESPVTTLQYSTVLPYIATVMINVSTNYNNISLYHR